MLQQFYLFEVKNIYILVSFFLDAEAESWQYIDIATDILFWIDLIMNFISSYNDEDGKIVKLRRTIFMNYLKGWFTVDFLSCLPLNYVLDGVVRDKSSLSP